MTTSKSWQASSLLLLVLLPAGQAQYPFRPAAHGCAMAHCDSTMSDESRMPPLVSPQTSLLSQDSLAGGSGKGLGCASNGSVAVCSYRTAYDSVIAYSAKGQRLWTSQAFLNGTAYSSVPMIDQQGTVIAADHDRLIRFSPKGTLMWHTLTPGGYPISPVQTNSGAIFLATRGGPVSIYDPETGALLGSQYLYETGTSGNFFETLNTPCVVDNRVFVSTQLNDGSGTFGRLFAIDVDITNAASPFTVAWTWDFRAPSGASPTCVAHTVFFDGDGLTPSGPGAPMLFAVQDKGTQPLLLWHQPMAAPVPASVVRDPRGGIWSICAGCPKIQRRSLKTGVVAEAYDVSTFINDGANYIPSSAMTISGGTAQPVMTLGIEGVANGQNYVIAVDLAARALLWKQDLSLGYSDKTAGQFPTLQDANGKPVVAFSCWNSGAYFVTAP